MNDKLFIPNSNIEILDGAVVILARFPDVKWVLHHGWYSYNGRQEYGWYFCSIPAQTTLPVNDSDIETCTVVSQGHPPCPPCPPGPVPPIPPRPVPPGPIPPPTPIRPIVIPPTFISVQTIFERDQLNTPGTYIPNGKLVRVNDVEGEVKYFVWDATERTWQSTTLVEAEDIINTYEDEKILSLQEGMLSAQISISTLSEDDKTYLVLRGQDDEEVSRVDVSMFLISGDTFESVALTYKPVGDPEVLHPFIRINYTDCNGAHQHIDGDLYDLVDTYRAAPGGGLYLNENTKEFSIANQVVPNPDGVNKDIILELGIPNNLKTVTYDEHGLITGEKTFTVTIPSSAVTGEVGKDDDSELITYITVQNGALQGRTLSVSEVVGEGDIPTSQAVQTKIDEVVEEVAPIWNFI